MFRYLGIAWGMYTDKTFHNLARKTLLFTPRRSARSAPAGDALINATGGALGAPVNDFAHAVLFAGWVPGTDERAYHAFEKGDIQYCKTKQIPDYKLTYADQQGHRIPFSGHQVKSSRTIAEHGRDKLAAPPCPPYPYLARKPPTQYGRPLQAVPLLWSLRHQYSNSYPDCNLDPDSHTLLRGERRSAETTTTSSSPSSSYSRSGPRAALSLTSWPAGSARNVLSPTQPNGNRVPVRTIYAARPSGPWRLGVEGKLARRIAP